MNYKHNIFLRILTERSIAVTLGLIIIGAFYAIPFFVGFLAILLVVSFFYIMINMSESEGLFTNIITFIFITAIVGGIMYKLLVYEPYYKHIKNDMNKSYTYSKGSEGKFIITILDGRKEEYTVTTKDERFLLEDTLDINITESNSWEDHISEKKYNIIKKVEKD